MTTPRPYLERFSKLVAYLTVAIAGLILSGPLFFIFLKALEWLFHLLAPLFHYINDVWESSALVEGGSEAGRIYVIFRARLELAYFLSGAFLLPVGIIGYLFAILQIREARKARLIENYQRIAEDWESSELTAFRTKLNELVDAFEREMVKKETSLNEDASACVNNFLQKERVKESREYERFLLFAVHLENLAQQCRTDHIELRHVVDLIGSSLFFCTGLIVPHIRWRRVHIDKSESTFANLLWLHSQRNKHKPYRRPL